MTPGGLVPDENRLVSVGLDDVDDPLLCSRGSLVPSSTSF